MADKQGKSCLTNCSQINMLMVGQCFSFKDENNKIMPKFITWDHEGMLLVFEFEEDYGAKKGQAFHGKIAERPSHVPIDNKKLDDQILLIEAERLKRPSVETLKMLQNSRIVITDSSDGLPEVVKNLETTVNDHTDIYANRTWDECFPQRVMVMQNLAAFLKLKQVLQYGSKVENEQEEDLEDYEEFAQTMKKITIFADQVADGFWKTGSKST